MQSIKKIIDVNELPEWASESKIGHGYKEGLDTREIGLWTVGSIQPRQHGSRYRRFLGQEGVHWDF
jgi:hypothetical protein